MLAPTSEVEKTDSGLTAFQIDSLGRYPEFVAAIEELRRDGVWVSHGGDAVGGAESG